jgi:hypothetical protein
LEANANVPGLALFGRTPGDLTGDKIACPTDVN